MQFFTCFATFRISSSFDGKSSIDVFVANTQFNSIIIIFDSVLASIQVDLVSTLIWMVAWQVKYIPVILPEYKVVLS